MTPTAFDNLLTNLGKIVTAAYSYVTSAIGVITSNPLLELGVLVAFCGIGVGMLKRLISTRV